MALRRDDRCGSRFRRGSTDDEPHVPETEPLGLTGLGEAFIDALKDDERFRDVFADPFGEKQGPAATA
ncbi:MAG: hypothetical protein JWR63_2655 [Conexibacter sp.]|nr:hypothetical protein [Conexibacter sp.]